MDTKSYLMGLFDGEGSIRTQITNVKSGRPTWVLAVTVAMASKEAIDLFIATWGGAYHQRSKPTKGGLILHQVNLNSSKAIPFLEYAVEHSIVKRDQCKIALQLARNMAKYSWARERGDFNPFQGGRYISDEDFAERTRLITEMRALMGARSRFGPKTISEQEPDGDSAI